jgi:hypothetical protein
VEILLAIIPVWVLYMVVKHVMGQNILNSLLSPDFDSKYIIPVVSQSGTFSSSSLIALMFFVLFLWAAGNALSHYHHHHHHHHHHIYAGYLQLYT